LALTPRHIFFIIADSLRYDSVHGQGINMPYVETNSISFTQARSAGCWTLPATASLFSGLIPHEHGATAQTRAIREDIPTLAEKLKKAGYKTFQVTANVATTEVFGLHRGFDKIYKIWEEVPAKSKIVNNILLMLGKPRMRKRLLSKDYISQKLGEDLNASKVWMQNTYMDVFNKVKQILKENESQDQKCFFFINVMESHFPYHISPQFSTINKGIWSAFSEVYALYHTVNQSFLKTDKEYVKEHHKNTFRQRQKKSWNILAPAINEFIRELHENKENLVVFASDHGDNFGEQNWLYHFSNVTDAGNRVPLFWLSHKHEKSTTINYPVSSRFIHQSILDSCALPFEEATLFSETENNLPLLQSYWYNNSEKTLPKYKYNQFCFLHENLKYVYRNEQWLSGTMANGNFEESNFSPIEKKFNPIEEIVQDDGRKKYLQAKFEGFKRFSSTIKM
jgi:arylsulfatase